MFGCFEPNCSGSNSINRRIKEYADNFCERLFRHIYKNAEVTLRNVFVQPKIYDSNGSSQELVSILGNFLWNEKETRILFIEGDAACGKSSFISYLCYHYRQADKVGKGIFLQANLICIRLRDLDIDEKQRTVEESIKDYLGFSNDNDYVENKIRFDNYVLILDGADELGMLEGYGKSNLEGILESIRRIFKRNKIIVTTRPQYIDYEKLRKPTFKFKVVQMQHFDAEMRKEWVEKYEKCGEQIPAETKDYILNINEKKAAGVADTPLALYLLVACEMRTELQSNIWTLYHEIFTNSIIETEYDENFDSSLKHPIRKNKTLLLEIVSRIAFEIFKKSENETYYIRAKELDAIVNEFNLNPSNARWIRKCCVLCAYWRSDGKDGTLEFYHNNIRDYFFSEYIYNRINRFLLNDSVENMEAFLNCMPEIMSYGEIAGTTWEETFLFLYERVRYEKKNITDKVEKYKKMMMEKFIYSIFANVLCEETIWKYSYGGNNYQKMKYTVSNTLLLLRVWQEGLDNSIKTRRNTFGENHIDMRNIVSSSILSDWSWMFEKSISIPPYDRKITIGQHCVISNVSFNKKYLERERFEDSRFERTSFEQSFLKNTVFEACTFVDGTSFSGATLVGVDFSGSILRDCLFYGTTIINGNFKGCIIENCCFDHINFRDHQIVECTFTGCTFKEGNFENVYVENVQVQNGNFEKADFTGARLVNNKWENVNFAGADFSKAENIYESDVRQLKSAGAVLLNKPG